MDQDSNPNPESNPNPDPESDPELITDLDPNLQIIPDPDAQHCNTFQQRVPLTLVPNVLLIIYILFASV